MERIDWKKYPRAEANEYTNAWLTMEFNRQLAPNTVDAYARAIEDFLKFCGSRGLEPEEATREQMSLYIGDLGSRYNSRLSRLPDGPRGLSNATIQLRLTACRRYFEYLLCVGKCRM